MNETKRALILNYALILIIVGINAFTLWGLFGPKVALEVKKAVASEPTIPAAPTPDQGNRLIIPKIFLDQPITEGPTESALNGGVWRRPNGAVPGQDSNTVIAGHRFSYSSPSTFYNLDQVAVGDEIGVLWQGRTINYVVSEIRTVAPSEVSIEGGTSDETLTLYTCAPLWTVRDRLVVIAKEKM